MPSLIPGFEYDIFISYRQKDNKYDGWVTEFVDNLKKELEATFKEDISVYFDINPHDGLLESHEVGDSLKEKLKCLIFIPIISRTYCDPKSYAWEHEFKAFVDQASKDQFGLKVKLPGGNVASRVLPVRIYDLNKEDINLFESVTGGVLRGIEFIYKSAGVNRPLRLKEENPQDNLNHTIFRDQINKIANAIKEIITGLRIPEKEEKETSKRIDEERPSGRRNNRAKIIAGSLMLLALITAGYFIVQKMVKPKVQLEKSIAVLPFHNYSEDPNQELRSDALTNEIINHLYKIKSFDRVVPFTSVLIYKKTDKNNTRIADELNVNYILDGTYQRIGDSLKITANLIEPQSDKYIWQNDYNKPYKEIISIQSDIALQIAAHIDAFLTTSEKQNIQKVPTTNMKAYDLVQQAFLYSWNFDTIMSLALEAIRLDPNYADAYAGAGCAQFYPGVFIGLKEMREAIWDALPYIEKALELDPNNSLAHLLMGNINEWGRWNYVEAEKEYLKVKELSPNMSTLEAMNLIFEFFAKMNQKDRYIKVSKKLYERGTSSESMFIKSLIISGNSEQAYDSLKASHYLHTVDGYKWLGETFIWLGEYDSARYYLDSALNLKDAYMLLPRFQTSLALAFQKTNQTRKAGGIISQIKNQSKLTSAGSPHYFVGWYYSGVGEIDSAFCWLEKAYEKNSPEFPWLRSDPAFDNLRGDKRYWDLYERTGHKAYDDYVASKKK
jgi:TolB-like protein